MKIEIEWEAKVMHETLKNNTKLSFDWYAEV